MDKGTTFFCFIAYGYYNCFHNMCWIWLEYHSSAISGVVFQQPEDLFFFAILNASIIVVKLYGMNENGFHRKEEPFRRSDVAVLKVLERLTRILCYVGVPHLSNNNTECPMRLACCNTEVKRIIILFEFYVLLLLPSRKSKKKKCILGVSVMGTWPRKQFTQKTLAATLSM